MKKIVFTLMASAMALGGFMVINGCSDPTVSVSLGSPSLQVVDARSGAGIDGVSVKLTPVDTEVSQSSVTASSDSSGNVSFSDVSYGTYVVTGTKNGWAIVPFEATVGNWNDDLGIMYGAAATKGADPDAVSIFLIWGDSGDVDAHLTYPDVIDAGGAAYGTFSAANAYYPLDEARTHVGYFGSAIQYGTASDFAMIDVDDTNGTGPETVSLMGANAGSGTTTLTAVNAATPYVGGLLTAGNYYWMGAAEYYVDSYTSGTVLDDKDVKVIITQGEDIKGIFVVPVDMSIKTLSLLRVQIFYDQANTSTTLVFMPDVRLVQDATFGSGIKSLGGASVNTPFAVTCAKK